VLVLPVSVLTGIVASTDSLVGGIGIEQYCGIGIGVVRVLALVLKYLY
jgi:hypothetical protein